MENEVVVKNYQNKHLLSTPLYTDMAGGLNTRVSPPQMAINQSQQAVNVIYNIASGAISARDGTIEYNPNAIPLQPEDGVFAFTQAKFNNGSKLVVIGGHDGSIQVCYADDSVGQWTILSNPAVSAVPVPYNRRVSTCFYNDALVCFDGVNPPY